MEGVEFTMTFLRVIKWISFVVVILSLALVGVAHGFVFCEMNLFDKDAEVKYMMADVKNAVQDADDVISSLLNKKEDAPEGEAQDAEPVKVDETTPGEAIAPVTDTPAPSSAYSVEGKNEIIVSVMKYGTFEIEMNWLTKLIGAETFKINLGMLVAYIGLFVAFILNIITKKNKSFYGYVLMFFGYILFAGILALGYYFGAYMIGTFETTLVSEDVILFRTYAIIASFFLATLIGLPYYRLGVRQIANKTYKKRIDNYKKKLQRR